jgi:hypothetical protein
VADVFLYPGEATPKTIRLANPSVLRSAALAGAVVLSVTTSAAALGAAAPLSGDVGLAVNTAASLGSLSQLAGNVSLDLAGAASLFARAGLQGSAVLAIGPTGAFRPVGPAAALAGSLAFAVTAQSFDGTDVHLSLDGVEWAANVIVESLVVDEELDETPNTCQFTAMGATPPTIGQRVLFTLASPFNPIRQFAGTILSVQQTYLEDLDRTPQFQCSAIDDTWRLNGQKVIKRYRGLSATAIVLDLLATYAPWVGTWKVETGLPVLDEFTATVVDLTEALTRVARRVGAHWDLDYFGALVFAITEDITQPRALTPTHPSLEAMSFVRDLAPEVTRVLVEGGGVTATAEADPGETMLPVEDVGWYSPSGGFITSGPQRVAYAATVAGGSGAVVGPGAAPSTAPVLTIQSGDGLAPGVYKYAYTDKTPTGESLPSPLGTIRVYGAVAAPLLQPGIANNKDVASDEWNGWHNGDTVEWCYAYGKWTYATGMVLLSHASPVGTQIAEPNSHGWWFHDNPLSGAAPSPAGMQVTWVRSVDPNVTHVVLFYRINGGAWLTLGWASTVMDNLLYPNVWTWSSPSFYAVSGIAPPTTAATFKRVAVDGLALGSGATSSRRIYRTAANGSQLLLLAIFSGNVTTGTYIDSTPDASLGTNAPISDSSGLVSTAAGTVLPGSTSIPMASAGQLSAAGGWVTNGHQWIRYHGITGNTLTGIPESGPGALASALDYGESLTAVPMLIGIPASGDGAIVMPIVKGDQVNIVVQVDDFAAQATLSHMLDPLNLQGGRAGIREAYLSDGRIGYIEARARGLAELALAGGPLLTVSYVCRDVWTHAGSLIAIAMPAPTNLTATLKIQHVSKTQFGQPNAPPLHTVSASSRRFTFEDLLRVAGGTSSP